MNKTKKGHEASGRGVSTGSTTAKTYNILMALLCGGLLTAAWPTWGIAPLVFIGLVPLLLVEGRIAQGERGKLFWIGFLAFFIWNVATTWWVWNATPAAILAWILNALFMTIVFNVFHQTKRKVCNNPWGNFLFIPYWMAFEYLTYLWAAKWPWLNLGNVFSQKVSWIQWYEYTGVAGGTLWILLINILIVNTIQFFKGQQGKQAFINSGLGIAVLLLPIIMSRSVYKHYEEQGTDTEVIVVQQNCDPWNEQFDSGFFDKTILHNIILADSIITSNTRFIVGSESAIQEGIHFKTNKQGQIDKSETIKSVRALLYLQGYVKGDGLEDVYYSYLMKPILKNMKDKENYYRDWELHIDTLNSLSIKEFYDHYHLSRKFKSPDSDTIKSLYDFNLYEAKKKLEQLNDIIAQDKQLYSKLISDSTYIHELNIGSNLSELVSKPNVAFVIGGTTYERGADPNDFPARKDSQGYYYCHNSALLIDSSSFQYRNKSQLTPAVEAIPEWMGFLRNYSITMGIARGTLKGDPEAKVMTFDGHKIGAAICYESAFGEYVSSFTKKGADLLFVITNDGWWGHTPGYRQHFEFSKLRAIENRRCVARSANTGRSGFINQRGDVLQQTHYWVPDAIKATLKANTKVTFYAKHGDYLSRIAVYLTFVGLLTWIAKATIGFSKTQKATKTDGNKKKKK